MSLLPQDAQQALAALLQALQSNDNVVRSQAEESLNTDWILPRPELLLMGLVERIQSGGDNTVGLQLESTHRKINLR